jgi:hypothetical protein
MCFASFKGFVTRSNESTQTIHQHTKQKNNTYKKLKKKQCKKTQPIKQKEKQKIMI